MSSSSKVNTPQEQVFINFRGVELRYNFVSHLEKRLKLNKINAFIDTDEEKGQKLNVLLNRIEESRIALAIFSPRYTESEWCLKELAKMKERMDQNKLVVIPIFYKVEPYTVRALKGDFGKKFRDLTVDKKIKTTWEEALESIALIIGFVVDERSDEYELITNVVDNVKQVLRRLSQESPIPPKNVVGLSPSRGIEHPLKQQEEKLSFGSEETRTRTIGVVAKESTATVANGARFPCLPVSRNRNKEAPVPTSAAVAKKSTATVATELTRYKCENMIRLLKMGRSCTTQYPGRHPSMPEVTRLLEEISHKLGSEEKLSYGSEETATRAIGVDCMPGIGKTTFTRRLFGQLKNGFWRNVAAPVPTSSAAVAKKSTVANGAPHSSEDGASRNPVVSKDLTFFVKPVEEFDLEDLLRSSAEILGKGTLGSSYKLSFHHGLVIALKRLKDEVLPEKEFKEKMQVLGSISHVNLVTLIAYYFSHDEKLLIFEYMSRGSLANLLHGKNGSDMSPLNWETRIRIALGAARAISYLHSRDATTCHGNIKSSNILLSECFEAKVSDYCLTPIISPTYRRNHIDGYSAPQVMGTSNISQKTDVYSFGVLLLELLTGLVPFVHEVHKGEMDLPSWVSTYLMGMNPADVFDPGLSRYKSDNIENMFRLLKMGIRCTAQYPDKRPSMPEVTRLIEEISHKPGPLSN